MAVGDDRVTFWTARRPKIIIDHQKFSTHRRKTAAVKCKEFAQGVRVFRRSMSGEKCKNPHDSKVTIIFVSLGQARGLVNTSVAH